MVTVGVTDVMTSKCTLELQFIPIQKATRGRGSNNPIQKRTGVFTILVDR